jgi:large subunit ribosomal protein L23
MSIEKLYDVLRSPVITEKSTALSEQNKISFKVPVDAAKKEIKDAVEKLFNVKVQSVNTIKVHGKTKRFKGKMGKRADIKKAIVTLKEGESVDIMSGAK